MNTSRGTSRLGLQVVGRVVAVVLAARELARRRPVARVVALLAVEPSLARARAKRYSVAFAHARLAGRRRFGARCFGAGFLHRHQIRREGAHGLSRRYLSSKCWAVLFFHGLASEAGAVPGGPGRSQAYWPTLPRLIYLRASASRAHWPARAAGFPVSGLRVGRARRKALIGLAPIPARGKAALAQKKN